MERDREIKSYEGSTTILCFNQNTNILQNAPIN